MKSEYRYRAYYNPSDGPSQSDPLATDTTPEQIAEALRSLLDELRLLLPDDEAEIIAGHVSDGHAEVEVLVRTTLDRPSVTSAIEQALPGTSLICST